MILKNEIEHKSENTAMNEDSEQTCARDDCNKKRTKTKGNAQKRQWYEFQPNRTCSFLDN